MGTTEICRWPGGGPGQRMWPGKMGVFKQGQRENFFGCQTYSKSPWEDWANSFILLSSCDLLRLDLSSYISLSLIWPLGHEGRKIRGLRSLKQLPLELSCTTTEPTFYLSKPPFSPCNLTVLVRIWVSIVQRCLRSDSCVTLLPVVLQAQWLAKLWYIWGGKERLGHLDVFPDCGDKILPGEMLSRLVLSDTHGLFIPQESPGWW